MKQTLGSEVPLEDTGFRHGRGVFETLLVRDGKALFPEWHWESLCTAARALGLSDPIPIPLDHAPGMEGIWRWFHTETGIRATWDENRGEIPESISVKVSPICHPSMAWTSRYKTLSYLGNIQARSLCAGGEALLLNEHGKVATAAMANIFWIKDDILFTPSTDCGCRAGVVRRWILEHSGITVQEVEASVEELLPAQEVFLTNSRLGIVPVHDIEGHPFAIGEKTRALQERYSACLTSVEE